MTDSADTPRHLEEFVLVRLLAAGKPPGRSAVEKELKPYFGLPDSAWKEAVSATLAGLAIDGQIESKPLVLTDTGREAAMKFLGVKSLPTGVKWPKLRDSYLVACALGVDPDDADTLKKVGGAPGVRCAVLARHYGLPGPPVPTPKQTLNMLAWQQLQTAHALDVPTMGDFTAKNVLLVTVARGQKGDPIPLLAAQALKVNNDVKFVREAVIRQWVGGREAGAKPPAKAQPFDLRRFAERVREVAKSTKTGRFGDNKVFISHVWERCRSTPETNGLTREQFHERLVEANKEDLLTLSRADLVSAMDPQDVAASEIRLPHSTFHFIRTDR